MPAPEYMKWKQYDAVEPLSVTHALDRLFARLLFNLALRSGNKQTVLENWLTFEPTEEIIRRKGIESFKQAVKRMKMATQNKAKK